MLTKKVNFKKYKKRIDSPFTREIAESLKTGISKRTNSGKDFEGKTFEPYTKRYAAKKGVSRSDVNLHVSGNMTEAIKYDIRGDTLNFSITGSEGKKAHGNQERYGRKFFGIDKKQLKLLEKIIGKVIVKQ